MISLENFYWILHHNLLEPCGLEYWYYHPFGTMNTLSKNDLTRAFVPPKKQHHVLFHFDQEPIWDNNFGSAYDVNEPAWSHKIVRILANSEHSCLKKHICKRRGLLDWYFFYHGFAALDWFWDSQYVGQCESIQKTFVSFNHLVTSKRAYRMSLTARLLEQNLDAYGDISFHASAKACVDEIMDPNTPLSIQDRILIERRLCGSTTLPRAIDQDCVNGDFSAHFGLQEYRMWQRYLLHVVNETVFYDSKLHLTEKIFKPIVALRPFILVAAPGNLAYLRSYGFETFSRWIDESYDAEQDPDARLQMIATEIGKLCRLPLPDLLEIYNEMLPLLVHNKQHFFNDFRHIITQELVDNFDTCLRIWNNGRVDGRESSRHPNLDLVKQTLLS